MSTATLPQPAERLQVVPGLPFPFYPGRPMAGFALRTPEQAVAQLVADLDRGYFCQSKLNGDRAGLAVVSGAQGKELLVQNRHGGFLYQTVKNQQVFASLPAGTCLDGEVMPGGLFYPFECVALDGVSLLAAPTQVRVHAAQNLCQELGLAWLFASMTTVTVAKLRRNLPFCEGYVRKDNGPYPLGRSATAETPRWVKMKW